MEESDLYTPLYFQLSVTATSQLHSLLDLKNKPDQFAFTDKVILCSDGFISFHGFLVSYFNGGNEDSEDLNQQYINQEDKVDHSQNASNATGTASDDVINMGDFKVADVAKAVLFLYVGTIALWPTLVIIFREALIGIGCNPQRVQVMNNIEAQFYTTTTGSPAIETAGGKKLGFWRNVDCIISVFFVTANGSILSADYAYTLNNY